MEGIWEAVLAIRLNLETGGKLHTVEIKSPGGPTHRRWIVSVQNETHTREHPIDLMAHSGNRMVFSINNRIFDLIVEPVAKNEYRVDWGNSSQKIRVTEGLAPPSGALTTEHSGPGMVRAEMPGKIVAVLKKPGDSASRGDGILVIEAMKMQNEIRAPKTGTLKSCPVKPEDHVNTGDLLFEIT